MKFRKSIIPAIVIIIGLFVSACTGTTVTPPDDEKQENPVTPEEDDDNDTTPPEEEEKPEPVAGLLKGTVIGTQYSVDYGSGQRSETVNTKDMVFDGKYDTFFASYDRSNTWVGLDLGTKHIIKKIGYSPRISQPGRVELAIIEGANTPDFSDAMPIYMIKSAGRENDMTYAGINCIRGFRYVRYVTPNNVRCNLAELEFYGYPGNGDDSRLYQITNIPTVVINTEGAQDIVSKEVEIKSTVYIISNGGRNLLFDQETGVRGRGNASWNFPKKPYRLKFSSKCSPLNAPAKAKKWTLISNYGDKTLMRNILAFEVSRRVGMDYTPFCYPVDVVLNGEYKGCYQLCDQIEAAAGRVDITKMKPTEISGSDLTGGYLIEIDAYAGGEPSHFYSARGIPVTIKSPDDEDIVSHQRQYIIDYFNKMEASVFSSDFSNPDTGYRKYLDLDSFLKLFIVGEFAGNTDTYWSVYMSKDRNSDKFHTGPVWDYDLAFENDRRTHPINGTKDFLYRRGSVASEAVREMVYRITTEDAAARKRLIELWNEACTQRGLDEASLMEYVNNISTLIDASQELNFKRWPILNTTVHENYTARGSFDAEVDAVCDYIKERIIVLGSLLSDVD